MAIEDGLERIVLYDLRMEEPKVRESWHDWTLFLDPTVRKLSMTGDGAETEEPFDDELEVLITDVDGNEIRQTHRFGQGPVQIVVKNEPVTVQLDPRGLFLDRDRDDNKAAVVPE